MILVVFCSAMMAAQISVTTYQYDNARTGQNTHEISLKLISFVAEADDLSAPWVANGVLERPSQKGVIAVTSACHSIAAKGVLGLGFVTASTADNAMLEDPSRQFRNIRRTQLPFYDTSKRRPRLPWR